MINWKYEINDIINIKNKHFKILDKEIRHKQCVDNHTLTGYIIRKQKWYKCYCFDCDNTYWTKENELINTINCPICTNKLIIHGYNDVSTTNPELVKYFTNIDEAYSLSVGSKQQISVTCPICMHKKYTTPLILSREGFYCNYCNSIGVKRPDLLKYFVNIEDAFKFTCYTKKSLDLKCPYCKTIKNMSLNNLSSYGFVCNNCHGGMSYPERLISMVLKSLNVDYIFQLTKKNFKWCKKYKYDFYLPKYDCIIEVHGAQHYSDSFFGLYKDISYNDKCKYELAVKHVCNYVVIDARNSNKNWIKNSIVNSKLNNIINISEVDWESCEKKSEKSLIKEVCDYYNNNKLTYKDDVTQLFHLSNSTIRRYLQIGSNYNWFNYEEYKDNNKKSKNKKGYKIDVYKNNKYLASYQNAKYLSQHSIDILGVKLYAPSILNNCRNINDTILYKGYKFYFSEIGDL